MVTEEFVILLPRQFLPASSATEPLPPDFADCPIELPEASSVRRTSVILVVASELGIEGLLLLVRRLMAVLPAPFGYSRQAPSETLLHRLRIHHELPSSAACADVRKTEEIERGWVLPLPLRMFLRVPPKVHSLLRVERQTIFYEPLR